MKELTKIISAEELDIGYDGKKCKTVYKDINVDAQKGELIAIVGQNGVGKSTLLRSLARLQKSIKGSVYIRDRKIDALKRLELAKVLSYVSTEILHVRNLRVIDLVGLGRFPHTNWLGRLRDPDLEIVHEAIRLVGLQELVYENMDEISDGERQRAMIARTLAQDTEIIILDEPTAFLDLPNKYEIIHILGELSGKKGKTVIFSTHDMNIAVQEADKIWLMLPERIICGSPEDLILANAFDNIFENSRLDFDSETGDFKMKRNVQGKVRLTGAGKEFFWTRRAIERLGLELTTDHLCNIKIDVSGKPGEYMWRYQKNHEKLEFRSIYDLTLRLKLY